MFNKYYLSVHYHFKHIVSVFVPLNGGKEESPGSKSVLHCDNGLCLKHTNMEILIEMFSPSSQLGYLTEQIRLHEHKSFYAIDTSVELRDI